MKSRLITIFCLLLAGTFLVSANKGYAAEPWESIDTKLTFVIPFGAGGSTNATSRIMARKLRDLGLEITAVNKPGAGGTQATHWCSQQPPDSGVMCVMSPSSFLYNPALEDTGYDMNDFDPVATWGGAAFAFAVTPDSKYKTIEDVFADAKSNPEKVSIGSTGTGDQAFLIEQMFEQAGAKITYVSFKGGGEVSTNLIGNHVDVGYVSVAGLAQLVNSGTLRMLAHTSPFGKRLAAFPDVPHISDYGYNQQAVSFYSLWGPKGMSENLRRSIAAAIEVASGDAGVIEENNKLGLTINFRGVDETQKYINQVNAEVVPPFVAWVKKNLNK